LTEQMQRRIRLGSPAGVAAGQHHHARKPNQQSGDFARGDAFVGKSEVGDHQCEQGGRALQHAGEPALDVRLAPGDERKRKHGVDDAEEQQVGDAAPIFGQPFTAQDDHDVQADGGDGRADED